MRINIILLIIMIFSQNNCLAQNQLFGIQVGNTISLPRETNTDFFNDRLLLRYSIGVLGRKRIVENIKGRFIAPLRKGAIELDYGLNLVFKGFDYKFGNTASSGDQISLEFPLLLNFFDERNVFMSRRQLRKGINTFMRIGIKPSYSFNRQFVNTIINDEELVIENLSERPFNLIGVLGGGLMQRMKNGGLAFFELSINLGLLKSMKGEIKYEKGAGQITEEIIYRDNGSYIALNVAYFLNRKDSEKSKRKELPPIIYNPRYLK